MLSSDVALKLAVCAEKPTTIFLSFWAADERHRSNRRILELYNLMLDHSPLTSQQLLVFAEKVLCKLRNQCLDFFSELFDELQMKIIEAKKVSVFDRNSGKLLKNFKFYLEHGTPEGLTRKISEKILTTTKALGEVAKLEGEFFVYNEFDTKTSGFGLRKKRVPVENKRPMEEHKKAVVSCLLASIISSFVDWKMQTSAEFRAWEQNKSNENTAALDEMFYKAWFDLFKELEDEEKSLGLIE